jgi:arylsulfatase A-like enzyme
MRQIKPGSWAAVVLLCVFLSQSCTLKEKPFLIRFIDILQQENVIESPFKAKEDDPKALDRIAPGLKEVYDEFLLEDAGIGENPYFLKKKMRIGPVDINALLAPPRTHLRFSVWIPENSYLEFTYGIKRDSRFREKKTKRMTTFGILLEVEDRKIELFKKRLELTDQNTPLVFNFKKIDLSNFGGKRANLHLVTSGNRESLAFWFNPIIYQPREDTSNVILISLDTLRADHLGCYGYERDTSPTIDALAGESVLFLNTFAPSPWTLPSHISLMTSLNTINHGVFQNGQKLDASIPTLADFLRINGFYATAFTGGGFVSGLFGLHKGFNSYHVRGGIQNAHSAEALSLAAVDWIERCKDRSFFLFLHTYQIHNPYVSPSPYNEMFLREGAEYKGIDINDLRIARENRYMPLSDDLRTNIIDLYDAGIRYTDECLIRPLVDKLRQLDLYDRTMIILVSDHGEEFFDHQGWVHTHSVYDEVIKVPLIIKFFNSENGGRKIQNFIRLIDVMPTVLDLLGIDSSSHFLEGKSLLPLLQEESDTDKKMERSFISDLAANIENNHVPGKIALNSGPYKIIINEEYSDSQSRYFLHPPPAVPEIEIYDLAADPSESHNLALSRPELVDKMLDLMKKRYVQKMGKRSSEIELNEEIRRQLRALGYIK